MTAPNPVRVDQLLTLALQHPPQRTSRAAGRMAERLAAFEAMLQRHSFLRIARTRKELRKSREVSSTQIKRGQVRVGISRSPYLNLSAAASDRLLVA